jgi:beta-barrel assembly-enhancing protease
MTELLSSFNRFLSQFNQVLTQRLRRSLHPLIAVVVALSIVFSAPMASQAVPWWQLLMRGVQVIQLSSLSDNQEVALGRQINEQLLSQKFKRYSNSGVQQYIDEIGQKLADESDRSSIPYTFQVVEGEEVNAFATMGGYVYVTTGLVKLAENEAQLASVIAHEIGHIAGKHAVKQMRERAVTSGVLTAAGLDNSTAVNIGVELALNRPNSREDEYEADQKGLENMSRAGYATGAMVDFMEKLVNGRSVPTFLSTHPATTNRIAKLNEEIDPAIAYSGSGQDNNAYRSRINPLR